MERVFRRRLLEWYARVRRPLPWRATSDPYAIWISEVMLQQTRVATVVPYYERWLARFPTVGSLAASLEEDVLRVWAGLGYYSRARNLHRAAREMGEVFPDSYDAIRGLRGAGDYTAAAVASIAFGLPYAAVDGNVLRVLARVTNDAGDIKSPATRKRLGERAATLLDRRHPGEFNQAMMELGATVCVPRAPRCPECPVSSLCEARKAGTAAELPVKGGRVEPVHLDRTLYIVRRGGRLLFWEREGFYELPERHHVPAIVERGKLGEFRHCIMHYVYRYSICEGFVKSKPGGLWWLPPVREHLFSTTTRKALKLAGVEGF